MMWDIQDYKKNELPKQYQEIMKTKKPIRQQSGDYYVTNKEIVIDCDRSRSVRVYNDEKYTAYTRLLKDMERRAEMWSQSAQREQNKIKKHNPFTWKHEKSAERYQQEANACREIIKQASEE